MGRKEKVFNEINFWIFFEWRIFLLEFRRNGRKGEVKFDGFQRPSLFISKVLLKGFKRPP